MKPVSSLVIPGELAPNLTPGTQRQTPRALRGGSWFIQPRILRASFRGGLPPWCRLVDFGSRLVLEVK